MTVIWAKSALLPSGWAEGVRIEVEDGRIGRVDANAKVEGHRVDVLLPAPANSHSHAFQRAMAGLTERRGPDPRDSFWTWRQLMFRFLDRLDPDQIEAIAAFVQMEMLEAGYGCNVEFHYLHHGPGGTPYDDLAETSARIAAAADTSGIGLTLLPVMYQYGGCDQRPLTEGQVRFGNDLDRFRWLFEGAEAAITALPADTVLGVAPHSLRAVAREDVLGLRGMAAGRPFHMHLAEQVAEVDEVKSAWRARPVDWVLDNLDPDQNCTFIHCTQMQPHETVGLAESGAVAGLCPITESSLGDGVFDGVRWFDADGTISIGSDSNIRIALSEELRTLDYSQRLRDKSRAALAEPLGSTGRRLFDAVLRGGAQSAGRDTGAISVGKFADLVALDGTHPDMAGRTGDLLLDTWIFAADDRLVRDVWSAGRHVVSEGRHVAREAITAAYRKATADLADAI